MLNNNLPEPSVQDQVEQPQEEFDVKKAVEQFDATQVARKDSLKQVQSVLEQASKGHNIDKKEVLKCIRGLFFVCAMQDALIVSLMEDFMKSIRSMAKNEVDSFNLQMKLYTITQALYKKELVTQEDLEEIHQGITLPKFLSQLQSESPTDSQK